MPDFGKFAFVVWTSYALTAALIAALVVYTLINKRHRK